MRMAVRVMLIDVRVGMDYAPMQVPVRTQQVSPPQEFFVAQNVLWCTAGHQLSLV